MTHNRSNESSSDLQRLHTIDNVANQLQVSTRTVRRWIDAGDLVAYRFGRQLRISEADLQTFIRMRREG